MGRCGCTSVDTCGCTFADSTDFTVSGAGSSGNPFQIHLASAINAVCKVCTSTTRPTSPAVGQLIYETDTFRVLIWTQLSTWRVLEVPAFASTSKPPPSQYGNSMMIEYDTGRLLLSDGSAYHVVGPDAGPDTFYRANGVQLTGVIDATIAQVHVPAVEFPSRLRINARLTFGIGGTAGEVAMSVRYKNTGGINTTDPVLSEGQAAVATGLTCITLDDIFDLPANLAQEFGVTVLRLTGDATITTNSAASNNRIIAERLWR